MRVLASILVAAAASAGCNAVADIPAHPHDAGVDGRSNTPDTTLDDAADDTTDDEASPDDDATIPDDAFTPADDVDLADAWIWDGYDPGDEYVDAADVCDRTTASPDAAPRTRFCEIYRDIIHHDGVGKCQTLGCHGGDHGHILGVDMGWTMESCYDKLTTFVTNYKPPIPARLVTPMPDGSDSRPQSSLMRILAPPTGFMPEVKSWVHNRKLTSEEISRFSAWLARGAPMD